MMRLPPRSARFPYATLFRSQVAHPEVGIVAILQRQRADDHRRRAPPGEPASQLRAAEVEDRKSTRLNSSRQYLVCRLLLEKNKYPHLVAVLSETVSSHV